MANRTYSKHFSFYKKISHYVLLLLSLLVLSFSCTPTEPYNGSETLLTISAEDASCTEVWIKLTSSVAPIPLTITLSRNDIISNTITLTGSDTIIVDTGLLPNTSYNYRAETIFGNKKQTVNNEITTLDTTSNNFTWETFTFGDVGSSVLYDVAIVGDEIWAVGAIYMKDSLGNPDHNAYNAVHWNGTKWELKRIKTYSICDPVDFSSIRSVVAFESNNIVFMTGGSIIKYDGINYKIDCTIRPLLTGRLNKLCVTSSNDLYVVGDGGNIAHWNGSSWKKIESGTSLTINNIYGYSFDNIDKQSEVIAVACNINQNDGRELLLINKTTAQKLKTEGLPNSIKSIWFKNSRKYYVIGDGVFTNYSLTQEWRSLQTDGGFPLYYKHSISGSDYNDIVISGSYGLISHFNGIRWKHFTDEMFYFEEANYLSVKLYKDMIVAIGILTGSGNPFHVGRIVIGRR